MCVSSYLHMLIYCLRVVLWFLFQCQISSFLEFLEHELKTNSSTSSIKRSWHTRSWYWSSFIKLCSMSESKIYNWHCWNSSSVSFSLCLYQIIVPVNVLNELSCECKHPWTGTLCLSPSAHSQFCTASGCQQTVAVVFATVKPHCFKAVKKIISATFLLEKNKVEQCVSVLGP